MIIIEDYDSLDKLKSELNKRLVFDENDTNYYELEYQNSHGLWISIIDDVSLEAAQNSGTSQGLFLKLTFRNQ